MKIAVRKSPLGENDCGSLALSMAKTAWHCLRRRCFCFALVLSLVPSLCWHIQAQPAIYSYDSSGSLLSVSSTNPPGASLIAQPQSQLLQSNAPVAFSVVAAGPGLAYQWLSNGVPIVGATGDSLVLKNLSSPNFATYRVIVSNASGSVTSAPAAVWPDSHGTGMPDWWQMQYFGNLNQLPTGDFDNDGVQNLNEYLESTIPNDAASFNPRLYVQSLHGLALASPTQPYYTKGQVITLTAIPDSGQMFLGWSGAVTGTKSPVAVVMASHKSIAVNFGLPLPVALDNSNLVWTTGGSIPWSGQIEISQDGQGAAQSGFIVSGQQSWLQSVTNLAQPMTLGFWWSVSSQPPDRLTFSVDGSVKASISGLVVDWEYVQTNLPAGSHTLLWTYLKSGNDSGNGPVFLNAPWVDAAWVDQVTLALASVPPVFQTITQAGGAISLSWSALAGRTYQLQYKTNLNQTNWNNLGGASVATNTTAFSSDPIGPGPQRFYRVALLP